MSEITQTGEYQAILRDVREIIDSQEKIVIMNSSTAEMDKIRLAVGMLQGMRQILTYLEEQ